MAIERFAADAANSYLNPLQLSFLRQIAPDAALYQRLSLRDAWNRSQPDAPGMTNGAKWRGIPSPEQRAAELAVEEREVLRLERWAYFRALLGCLVSLILGLALMGWSLHTTNQRCAGTAFWCGLLVGYGGITIVLTRLYRSGEEAGWW